MLLFFVLSKYLIHIYLTYQKFTTGAALCQYGLILATGYVLVYVCGDNAFPVLDFQYLPSTGNYGI